MREGYEILRLRPVALKAFNFANRAMALQLRQAARSATGGEACREPQCAIVPAGGPSRWVSSFNASRACPSPLHDRIRVGGPAVVPDRRREDGGLFRTYRVHARPPAAPGGSGGLESDEQDVGSDALHAAAAHDPAVPARFDPLLRLRRPPRCEEMDTWGRSASRSGSGWAGATPNNYEDSKDAVHPS